MPIKAVKHDLADAINEVSRLLKRDFGCDFAYSIMGNGCVLAQSNINGVHQPVPLVEPRKPLLNRTFRPIGWRAGHNA